MSGEPLPVGELQRIESAAAMPTYARTPVEFVRGRGSRMWDSTGKEYIDLFSGLSVHNVGHCHPKVVAAASEQLETFAGASNLFYSTPAMQLYERISESSLGGKVFLCNSGAEANECAIKLVRKHAHARGIERPEIIVLEGAFHGRTMGALSATVKLARADFFGPLLEGFTAVPIDDPAAMRAAVGPNAAAVMMEPVFGESGIFPVSDEVQIAAREACDAAGALLVFDEIQTGMGRTGTLWAYQGGPVTPDVMTTAKALGGGLPVGACVISPELGDGLVAGDHGSTFAGGPIGSRSALAAIEICSDPDLLAEVGRLGEVLEQRALEIDGVEAVRRRGLMVALALADGLVAADVAIGCLQEGVVVNPPNPATIRLLPPLVIGEEDLLEGIARIEASILRQA